ncbi:translation initiation factor eIF-2B subunit alpha, putative [Plasmodium yoelii]|uniref:Translation initiation factor eIF2B subunit alpha n=2 Tax=Plasmodium yoelii TaxID=5861 RepID=A0AAE9WTD4_PLAYO|nr:translation initiation factor eIF-2B subunit alpha, putative [Plasmodium yoelii]WBY56239.1 translation initiation factor eIF-2B subunit alpha [Plasmodium yoelii yoelii]CDU17145.1 translation initiation factor EIF-2b alpha subunit, putative [Plasmodium yoelii]VTZ76229.1 translation initiation factor eIF-2B subunit alpha, putative [Plasmodium yoelii]|eukprot:XP_022811745.1 translation initiation factor eIF-2B subunit alpha, putative [Plasmodium yoelii]
MTDCENSKNDDSPEEHEVVRSFKKHYFEDKDPMHIAAIKSLESSLKSSNTKTNFEYFMKLNEAKSQLNNYIKNENVKNQIILTPHSKRMTIYTIVTACDIYHHFAVKKYTHNENNFDDLKSISSKCASEFPKTLQNSLDMIAKNSCTLFGSGKTKILTYSSSDCVKALLLNVAKNKKIKICVYFTCPENCNNNNYLEKDKFFDNKFINDLKNENIDVIKINIQEIQNIFEIIDFVIIGTELVIDNGGIITKKGIKLISELCLLNKKELFVLCEAYKFLKIKTIQNYDEHFYYYCTKNIANKNNFLYEFVPHNFITLFYTDIGIFPPSTISFELNKLYINDIN